jgi:NAD(P)-dependent dehydrogenase (short-subunit alcohol dehydrogenase family)
MGEGLDQLAAQGPLNRVGTVAEVAAGIVFLASDTAAMIHGATLPVDGGRLAV